MIQIEDKCKALCKILFSVFVLIASEVYEEKKLPNELTVQMQGGHTKVSDTHWVCNEQSMDCKLNSCKPIR